MTAPSPQEICEIKDPVLRNLWITHTYHLFGRQLADRGLDGDATWPYFAVWASKTAGRIIRGDELPGWLRTRMTSPKVLAAADRANHQWRFLHRAGVTRPLHEGHLVAVAEDVSRHVSDRVAQGNVLVFRELAPIFEDLAAGRNPPRTPGLVQATSLYQTAIVERDPSRRAVLVLEANVRAVAHEQRRLQPYIASALRAPVERGLHRLVDREIARHLSGRAMRTWARHAIGEICDDLDRAWTEAVTIWLMILETADEHLDLHHPLHPAPSCTSLFPAELTGPAAEAAVHPWDRTGGLGTPCGAEDWTVLEQRMGYIVNLFRSRQRHPGLATPPYSPEQLDVMATGAIPAGPL